MTLLVVEGLLLPLMLIVGNLKQCLSFVFSSAQEVRDAGHQRTTDHVHQSTREWHHHHRCHHHPHHQVVIIVMIVIINKIVINVILQHHYSIKGGASAIGLGTDNCVQVMCDEK